MFDFGCFVANGKLAASHFYLDGRRTRRPPHRRLGLHAHRWTDTAEGMYQMKKNVFCNHFEVCLLRFSRQQGKSQQVSADSCLTELYRAQLTDSFQAR